MDRIITAEEIDPINEKYGKSGLDVLMDAGADVVVTNTLETPVSKVDVTEDVSNGIKKLYEEGFF